MKIGGHDRPLKFGVNQTDLYCTLYGITLSKYYEFLERAGKNEYTFGEIRDLIWSGLKDGARQAKIEFDIDPLTVGDWIDDDPARIINDVMVNFADSLPKTRDNGGETKKKVTKS